MHPGLGNCTGYSSVCRGRHHVQSFWKAPLRYSQTAQIQSKPRDPSKCASTSVCTGVERDYGEAFTLSGQRDGSAPSSAPPIPDHRPGISGLLSHNESTALTFLPPPVNWSPLNPSTLLLLFFLSDTSCSSLRWIFVPITLLSPRGGLLI